MRSRADAIGADFSIESADPKGTRISLRLHTKTR